MAHKDIHHGQRSIRTANQRRRITVHGQILHQLRAPTATHGVSEEIPRIGNHGTTGHIDGGLSIESCYQNWRH